MAKQLPPGLPAAAGRPRSARARGQRSTLSLRITAELFELLDQAAKAKGRPLSQEAELRLEYAARDERRLGDTLALPYGPQLAGLIELLATVLRDVGPQAAFKAASLAGGPATLDDVYGWMNNPFAYDQAVKAAMLAFEAFRPEGNPVLSRLSGPKVLPGPDLDLNEAYRNIGAGMMQTELAAVADPKQARTATSQQLSAEVRQKLGSISDRIPMNLERLRREKSAENG
jgi:hypothetical protein